ENKYFIGIFVVLLTFLRYLFRLFDILKLFLYSSLSSTSIFSVSILSSFIASYNFSVVSSIVILLLNANKRIVSYSSLDIFLGVVCSLFTFIFLFNIDDFFFLSFLNTLSNSFIHYHSRLFF